MTQVDATLALKSDQTYKDTQLAIKSHQPTTCTNTDLDTELAKNVITADMNVALSLKSEMAYVDNQLVLQDNQTTTYTPKHM